MLSLRAFLSALAALTLAACATTAQQNQEPRWVAAWATAQQIPEPHNALDPADMTDTTLRQMLRITRGGETLRVRISNVYGTQPLRISSVHLARAVQPGTAAIVPGSDVALTFSGQSDIIIPAFADYLSDPVQYPVEAFTDLAITLHTPTAPAQQTSHPGSRTTSFIARGNQVAALDLPGAKTVDHWYLISGIDVIGAPNAASISVIGDSITDGRGSTTNGNDRWTDYLARRLQADPRTREIGVLNHGLGGNRLLDDGLGPNALSRFDRDVLAQTGIRYLIIYEGVNDLGTFERDNPNASHEAFQAHARRMIAVYDQMVTRANAHGIKVIGATIAPYATTEIYRNTDAAEAARQTINDWIRTSPRLDGVADFDAVLRDPANPRNLAARYDFGDGLHPNTAAFEVMAATVPIEVFVP